MFRFQFFDQLADLLVEITDHSRIGSMRIPAGQISRLSGVGLFVPEFLYIMLYPAFGGLKRDVRQGSGPHQEKRFAFIGIDKSHQFIKDQIVGIFLLRIFSVAGWIVRIGTFIQRASVRVCHFVGQVDTFFVIIQKRRIVCVRLALAIVSVESVEPLFVGSSFGTRIPQSPLAETSGGISRLLHHSPDSHRVRL